MRSISISENNPSGFERTEDRPWRGTVIVMAAVLRALICVAAIGSPAAAAAQGVPSEPVSVLGGRLVFSGEAAITFGTPDHESYFNYTDYEHNAMRLMRVGVTTNIRLSDRVTAARTSSRDTGPGLGTHLVKKRAAAASCRCRYRPVTSSADP